MNWLGALVLVGCASRAPVEEAAVGEPVAAMVGTAPAEARPAPEFSARNLDGESRGREHLVGNPTVLWFFPKAATAG